MANNSPSSIPLFGSPTQGQVKAVRSEIEAYTANLIKNLPKARQVFEAAEPTNGEPGAPEIVPD